MSKNLQIQQNGGHNFLKTTFEPNFKRLIGEMSCDKLVEKPSHIFSPHLSPFHPGIAAKHAKLIEKHLMCDVTSCLIKHTGRIDATALL